MSKYYAKFLMSLVAVSLFCAGSARAETMKQAFADALSTHPALDVARAGEMAANREVRAEYSGYFPEISVNATGGRLYGDNSTSRGLSVTRGAGYSYLWESSIAAEQNIFDGFEVRNRVAAAEARSNTAQSNLSDITTVVIGKAATGYVDLMRTSQAINMLENYELKVEDYVGRIKMLVDEGASDEVEHQQALEIRAMLLDIIFTYRGQLKAAQAAYKEIIGRNSDGSLAKPSDMAAFVLPSVEEGINYAIGNHPALQSSISTARASGYDVDIERADFYPDLDGELSYFKSDKADILGGEAIDARAIMRMNWTFDVGGAKYHRLKKKRYEHQQSLSRTKEIERQIEKDIRQAYALYEAQQKRLENLKSRVGINKKLLSAYEAQFEGARVSLLQLLQIENQLFMAQFEEMNSAYGVMSAQYEVLSKTSRLAEAVAHEQ